MGNYIIDPAVFYWMNVYSIVQTLLAVIGAMLLLTGIGLTVWYFCELYYLKEPEEPEFDEDDSEYTKRNEEKNYRRRMKEYNDNKITVKRIRKFMIPVLAAGATMIVASIFVPGKQTSVEMLVAKTATFDNVDWTVQQVKEIVDYIVTALKNLN